MSRHKRITPHLLPDVSFVTFPRYTGGPVSDTSGSMHNPHIPYLLIPGAPSERVAFEKSVMTIGSATFTDVQLPGADVSRRHCRFYRVGNTFWVQDWYSSDGINYNGGRVKGIQGLLAGEGISKAVSIAKFNVHVECPASFVGDPARDLAMITQWFETIDNDFPDYQQRFWAWAEAMNAQL